MSRREGSHSEVADRYGLTERQRDVLAMMAEGRTNYDIAQALGLSLEGAKYHVSEILGKLGVDSREEAVAIATHRGWRWPSWRRLRVIAPVAALAAAGVVVAALLLAPGGTTKPAGPPHVWAALIHGPAGSPQAGLLEVMDATAGTRSADWYARPHLRGSDMVAGRFPVFTPTVDGRTAAISVTRRLAAPRGGGRPGSRPQRVVAPVQGRRKLVRGHSFCRIDRLRSLLVAGRPASGVRGHERPDVRP